jgi:hypothetical protein
MKQLSLIFLLNISFFGILNTQISYGAGFLLGGSNYAGDMSGDDIFTIIGQTLPAGGALFEISPINSIKLRTQFSIASVQGADRLSAKVWQKERNLDFKSNIFEAALMVEVHVLKMAPNLSNMIFSPYILGGIAIFHFNPRTKYKGDWIDLQPLGTEGQGLYPYKLAYKKNNLSFPLGAGLLFALSDDVSVSLEFVWRWTLTDYLDDLSGTYADYETLRLGNGELAALMAYRFHEISGVIEPYPFQEGSIRGNSDVNDVYAMGMLKVVYHWKSKYSNVYKINSRRPRYAVKCPTF